MSNSYFSTDKVYFKFIISLFVLLLAIFGVNNESRAIQNSELAILERGEVISKSLTSTLKGDMKGAEAKVIINSSPEEVWNLLINQEKMGQIIPKVKKVKVIEKTSNYQKVYTALKICPLLPTFKYTIGIDQREKYKRLKFNRIEGCFNKLYGTWELEPYQNKTILTYRLFFDLGFYVPPFIRSNSLNKDFPEIMYAVKKEAEKT